MLSKSIVAATLLAGASAGTTTSSYAHPGPQGPRGPHGPHGPRQCTTTSTAVVYATETVTSTVVQSWGAGGKPTWVGVIPASPVTVTVTVSPTAAWGSGSGSGSGNGGWGAGGSTTTSTVVAGGSGSGSGNGGWGSGGGSSSSVAGGNGNGGYNGGKPTTTSTAGPSGPSYTGTAPSGPLCLTNATASYLTNGYGQLLSAYTNATANSLLASDFTDTSDSINWLAGIPLGGYTFASKAAFIAGQGTQLPIGFNVDHMFFTCTEVAFRWTASVGMKKFPAKGINTFVASNLNNTAAGWQIQTMYSEFNVGAWEHDIGRTCSPQGANIAKA